MYGHGSTTPAACHHNCPFKAMLSRPVSLRHRRCGGGATPCMTVPQIRNWLNSATYTETGRRQARGAVPCGAAGEGMSTPSRQPPRYMLAMPNANSKK